MPAARTLFLKLSSVSRGSKLTLREALASDQLEDFVQQEEARGAELAKGPILSGRLPYSSPRGADQMLDQRTLQLAVDATEGCRLLSPLPVIVGGSMMARVCGPRITPSLDPAQLPRLIVRQFIGGCQEVC